MDSGKLRPSRWFYGLGIAIFLVGGVLLFLFLFRSLGSLPETLIRVVVPGNTEVFLSEPGNYTIFYEYKSVIENRVYATEPQLSGLKCSLVSKESGGQIPISASSKNASYSYGGRSGISIFDVDIKEGGNYVLSGWYTDRDNGPEIVLAIGHGFMKNLFITIFGGVAIFFGSIAAGVTIIVITFLKRRKSGRQINTRS